MTHIRVAATRTVYDSFILDKEAISGNTIIGDRREGDQFKSYTSGSSYCITGTWATGTGHWWDYDTEDGTYVTSGGISTYIRLYPTKHWAKMKVQSGSPLLFLGSTNSCITLGSPEYKFEVNGSSTISGTFDYEPPYSIEVIRSGSLTRLILESGTAPTTIFTQYDTVNGSEIGVGGSGVTEFKEIRYRNIEEVS